MWTEFRFWMMPDHRFPVAKLKFTDSWNFRNMFSKLAVVIKKNPQSIIIIIIKIGWNEIMCEREIAKETARCLTW